MLANGHSLNYLEVHITGGIIVDSYSDFDSDGIVYAVLDNDSDGDGLEDGNEDENGNGVVEISEGETDPHDSDTDDDGLSDGEEDEDGDGNQDLNNTSASDADTDGDGWDDNIESVWDAKAGAYGTRTSPVKNDTDHDGITDPLDWEPMVPDLKLELKVYEIICYDEDIDKSGPSDFRLQVSFEKFLENGQKWIILPSQEYIYEEDRYSINEDHSYYTTPLEGDIRWVKIKIELFDEDEDPDDKFDITPKKSDKELILYYDMRSSYWNGWGKFSNWYTYDGNPNYEGQIAYRDSEGQFQEHGDTYDKPGFATGYDDGKYEEDAAIRFEVFLANDYDGDGLSHYSEWSYSS